VGQKIGIYLPSENPERTDQIESIRVEGEIILKWMFQIQYAKLSAGLICFRTGNRGGFSKTSNEN